MSRASPNVQILRSPNPWARGPVGNVVALKSASFARYYDRTKHRWVDQTDAAPTATAAVAMEPPSAEEPVKKKKRGRPRKVVLTEEPDNDTVGESGGPQGPADGEE